MTAPETIWQITVATRSPEHDARGRMLLAEAQRSGFPDLTGLRSARLYQLRGTLEAALVETLARELFADPVVEQWDCTARPDWPSDAAAQVEVHLQPGIMDPVSLTALEAARDLLRVRTVDPARLVEVRTAWRYTLTGLEALPRIEALAARLLANTCIETVFIRAPQRRDPLPQRWPTPPAGTFERRTVPLGGLSDAELEQLSRRAHLFLSAEELRAIRDHFAARGADPTDLELETLAQTWSEHCVHKTLKSAVHYRGRPFTTASAADQPEIDVTYDNLLKDTIIRATRRLARPWCLSVFEDNAGIIEFDGEYGVAFKVETHNHPSAIEPYGGAATGIGGCIRDILGCGLGAKPVANTDVFCVGRPEFEPERLPAGVLHPRRVLRGVVAGVRDYGNRMGIPTLSGGLCFDDRYLTNPLVFCGCVGLIPRDRIAKAPRPGDRILLAGGRTGRDGLGGATFSSAELTDVHADEFAHAVQIGNAIEEKKVLDALLRARDCPAGALFSSITDCGAGGLSSAVGEMAATLGAVVHLERVPLKYTGLRCNEIWLSEAQERLVLAVPPENLARLQTIFAEEGVDTAVLGEFTGDGVLSVRYEGTEYGRLDVRFLHDGLPRRRRTACWSGPEPVAFGGDPTPPADALPADADLAAELCRRLAALNTCSRESVFRQYDQEVQGGGVLRPLVGPGEGPSDAAVIRPRLTSQRGVAIAAGLCPQRSAADPYLMAVFAIDEAIRNVISVGADPRRIALLDNFCWNSCQSEAAMGTLVRACQACHDAALAYGAPFISGKDSLNNQFTQPEEEARRLGLPATIGIPGTLLISALGLIADVRHCTSSDLKRPGSRLIYASVDLRRGGCAAAAALHSAVADLQAGGAVAACHDVSDGGLAVCLAEMCIGGRRGADLHVAADTAGDPAGDPAALGRFLFADERSGYVLEVPAEQDLAAMARCAEIVELGTVRADDRLRILAGTKPLADLSVDDLESAWRSGLSLD